jgi:hypothetical protein
MPKPRRGDNWTKEIVLNDASVETIVDAIQRRMPQLFRPDPGPKVSEVLPRHVDLDDLIGAKEGGHLVGRHERTIHRWQNDYDISEVVAGTKILSRRKLLTHAARYQHDSDDDP